MPSTTGDARFWDRAARKYAADPIKDMAGYERTIARTRELVGSSDCVLEIGCGTGTTALRLAPSVARILATDVSREMIAIAEEKVAAEGCRNVELAVASTESVQGADASFDAVLAFNVLHLVADRASALRHIHRLLKSKRLFISKTPCLSEMNPLIRLAVPVMQLFGRAPHVGFFTAEALERDIEAAGFRIIERARHGTGRKDPRIFIVAEKTV
jgi:ubiquinone/menaquinone biosynthesis C-methylase UbiE